MVTYTYTAVTRKHKQLNLQSKEFHIPPFTTLEPPLRRHSSYYYSRRGWRRWDHCHVTLVLSSRLSRPRRRDPWPRPWTLLTSRCLANFRAAPAWRVQLAWPEVRGQGGHLGVKAAGADVDLRAVTGSGRDNPGLIRHWYCWRPKRGSF